MNTWSGPTLPTGTLTFLFTDVEGSTRLWEEHPQAMRGVMARHDALLTAVVEQHDGVVVRPRGEGDSLFAVFVRASDAVAAALAGQRALAAEDWGEIGPFKVRMGLHTGEADLREGDYYGSAVNRCARIRAAGHGGQILLSHATAQLTRAALPAGIILLDLGHHGLKDLSEPEQLFQLLAPGLPDAFPALKTLDSRPHHLPTPLTSFVGREPEIEAITRLLGATRLLTLTGPGGIGKTRLAVAVARTVAHHFSDGVFFIDLSSVSDPALVIARIAQTLGVPGLEGERLAERMQAFLDDKDLLLVLDNVEQVVDAAPRVAELISLCRYAQALLTSRVLLHVQGEQEFAVPPLPVPAGDVPPSVETLMRYASVQLFVERTRGANPGFTVTADNAPAIRGICHRLDGLPLAIELAAARIKVLPPQAMLARLHNRLKLLTGGSRDLPARQQTVRATIDWSYDLLDHAEQTLFRRLAAFAGGWTLDAAEAVCVLADGPDIDVLDGLASLMDKSLVRRVEGEEHEPRFGLFETIREYALERLAASSEAEAIRLRHATHYLALAEQARQHLGGAQQPAWLTRLDAEHDNLWAAFEAWGASGELAQVVRMAHALEWFWVVRGHAAEGRARLTTVLRAPTASERSAPRAEALATTGTMAMHQHDFVAARDLFAESLEIHRERGSTEATGELLQSLGTAAAAMGDPVAARAYLEESLQVYRDRGNSRGVAQLLNDLANAAHEQREYAAARSLYAQSLALWRALDGSVQAAFVLNNWAVVAQDEGDFAGARALLEESVAIHRQLGEQRGLAVSIASLARLATIQADYPRAERLLAEVLLIRQDIEDTAGIAFALDRFAVVAAVQAQAERSLRLAGAASAQRDRAGAAPSPAVQTQLEQQLTPIRQSLGDAASTAAWAAGRALTRGEAIALALAYADAATASGSPGS